MLKSMWGKPLTESSYTNQPTLSVRAFTHSSSFPVQFFAHSRRVQFYTLQQLRGCATDCVGIKCLAFYWRVESEKVRDKVLVYAYKSVESFVGEPELIMMISQSVSKLKLHTYLNFLMWMIEETKIVGRGQRWREWRWSAWSWNIFAKLANGQNYVCIWMQTVEHLCVVRNEKKTTNDEREAASSAVNVQWMNFCVTLWMAVGSIASA